MMRSSRRILDASHWLLQARLLCVQEGREIGDSQKFIPLQPLVIDVDADPLQKAKQRSMLMSPLLFLSFSFSFSIFHGEDLCNLVLILVQTQIGLGAP